MSVLEIDRIYNMDCLVGLPQIAAQSIDLIITDPPFAISFRAHRSNYHRTAARVLEGYGEIAAADYYTFTRQWLAEAFRILKEEGSLYVFSGWNNLKDVLNALDEVGFVTVNHLIWKYQFGVVTRRRFVTSHYHCLYVCKNDARRKFFPFQRFAPDARDPFGHSLHYQDKEDVWNIRREYWTGDQKTPTKLPAELIRKILAYSSAENDVVCDPFLGSGQVAVVSKMQKRHYIGFEINPVYFEFAQTRLARNIYRLRQNPTTLFPTRE